MCDHNIAILPPNDGFVTRQKILEKSVIFCYYRLSTNPQGPGPFPTQWVRSHNRGLVILTIKTLILNGLNRFPPHEGLGLFYNSIIIPTTVQGVIRGSTEER